ncbi:AaceriAEL197Cp [[Ashbya] aceris (nom. inval.)]|nr:AaceriAEL197Cp [[Ashbya] aceris (nom. inval.)]
MMSRKYLGILLWLLMYSIAGIRCQDLPLLESMPSVRAGSPFISGNGDRNDTIGGLFNPQTMHELAPMNFSIVPGARNTLEFNVNTLSSGISTAYEVLTLLSGNICWRPRETEGQVLRVYYSFNKNILEDLSGAEAADFAEGYMEALAVRPYQVEDNQTDAYSTLYLVSLLVDTETGKPLPAAPADAEPWHYRLSVSQNDLGFQWDSRPWIEVIDTDYNSALLSTGNLGPVYDGRGRRKYDPDLYDLYLYPYEHINTFDGLSRSYCAVSGGPRLIRSTSSDYTEHPNSTLSTSSLKISKSLVEQVGQIREQFHITGLNSSTTYVAYLTMKVSAATAGMAGIIFRKTVFTTMENDACSLIFGLDFCKGVAYSVPTSSLQNKDKTIMAGAYDAIASSLYANFSLALQLIPCQDNSESRYSPLKHCDDCEQSYKSWLCAVTIPRCTTRARDHYVARERGDNRNALINNNIKPVSNYHEILPCIDMCHRMVRDCPPAFGFSCPSRSKFPHLAQHSYQSYSNTSETLNCNYIGNAEILST